MTKAFWVISQIVQSKLVGRYFGIVVKNGMTEASIPIGEIGQIMNDILSELHHIEGVLGAYPFGHVADGNIHLIVGKENNSQQLTKQINDIVYQPLSAVKGSISAEHGIGIDKKPYLQLTRSQDEIKLMKGLKQLFDPKNILNPGRIVN